MEEATRSPTIVREIELSLTPVFLLTAIGALLAFAGARRALSAGARRGTTITTGRSRG